MKNNGFTLIELLAVIVILAIITLISTPIVLNVIEASNKAAAERSIDGYIDAVKTQIVGNMLDNDFTNDIIDDTYTTEQLQQKLVSVNGEQPIGWVRITNKLVVDYSFVVNGYVVTKGEDTVKGTTTKTKPAGGSLAKVCLLKNGEALAIGSEYECTVAPGENKTFYVLEVLEDNVSLIMNQNINNTTIAYCDPDGPNIIDAQLCQADGAKEELPTTWTNVDEVSLPTGQQIANAVNNETWTDEGEDISLSTSTWLYNYLANSSISVPGVYGYWTSTSHSSITDLVWGVLGIGELSGSTGASNNFTCGVRPVITISKSKI